MAAPITSYSTLVTAILEAAEDDGPELQTYLPAAVNNAELRLLRNIDTMGLITETSVACSAGKNLFTKPTGHRFTRSVHFLGSNGREILLSRKTDDYLRELWPQATSTGTPAYYSEDNQTQFRVVPTPAATGALKVVYTKRPTPLSLSNETNYFTDFTPDALFHATMMEVAAWQRNQVLFNYHKEFYVDAITSVNNEGRRQRKDDGSPVGNMQPGQNLLQGNE